MQYYLVLKERSNKKENQGREGGVYQPDWLLGWLCSCWDQETTGKTKEQETTGKRRRQYTHSCCYTMSYWQKWGYLMFWLFICCWDHQTTEAGRREKIDCIISYFYLTAYRWWWLNWQFVSFQSNISGDVVRRWLLGRGRRGEERSTPSSTENNLKRRKNHNIMLPGKA